MQKRVLANWKANLSLDKAVQWCDAFAGVYRPRTDLEVVLAVPFLFLERIAERVQSLAGVSLASQGVSSYPQGNYTGAIPAAWLRGLARYTLLGHRERRRYFHETVQDVARQAYESLAEDLHPIVCFDRDVLIPQTAAMAAEELGRLIWAYTPDTPATFEMARGEAEIAALLPQIAKKTDNRPVLYGGGVTIDNGAGLWRLAGLGGIMLGRGCLDGAAFASLVNRL
ncbi:triose-phosphate isomerase [Desulfobulbus elongatus]|uniref:triose-phosphate isomerase n=1 Tax=Desulfobulbus elongatus TaxID=53332 RepID=UPI00047F94CE|nr:triose-phosphate isomerase family protein [Desulfobulbus elongatus]